MYKPKSLRIYDDDQLLIEFVRLKLDTYKVTIYRPHRLFNGLKTPCTLLDIVSLLENRITPQASDGDDFDVIGCCVATHGINLSDNIWISVDDDDMTAEKLHKIKYKVRSDSDKWSF